MPTKKTAAAPDPGAAAVDAYLARVPEPARATLEKLRATIRAVAPKDAVECMAYGMPAFRCDKAFAGYAAFKNHCGYFPMSGAVIAALKSDLEGFPCSKGGFQFPVDKPLSKALVTRLVRARLADIVRKGR